jgi:hypothetical protein
LPLFAIFCFFEAQQEAPLKGKSPPGPIPSSKQFGPDIYRMKQNLFSKNIQYCPNGAHYTALP